MFWVWAISEPTHCSPYCAALLLVAVLFFWHTSNNQMLCTFLILQLEVPLHFPVKLALKHLTADFNKVSLVPNVACRVQNSCTGSDFFVQLAKVNLLKLSLETSIRWGTVRVRASSWLHPLLLKMWCNRCMQGHGPGSCSLSLFFFPKTRKLMPCSSACWCTLKLPSDIVNPTYMFIIIITAAELVCPLCCNLGKSVQAHQVRFNNKNIMHVIIPHCSHVDNKVSSVLVVQTK